MIAKDTIPFNDEKMKHKLTSDATGAWYDKDTMSDAAVPIREEWLPSETIAAAETPIQARMVVFVLLMSAHLFVESDRDSTSQLGNWCHNAQTLDNEQYETDQSLNLVWELPTVSFSLLPLSWVSSAGFSKRWTCSRQKRGFQYTDHPWTFPEFVINLAYF